MTPDEISTMSIRNEVLRRAIEVGNINGVFSNNKPSLEKLQKSAIEKLQKEIEAI